MKLLYAEDERQLSMAVTEILKAQGYDVDAVYDGEEAWAQLQNNYYDAVILDIMMPKADGIHVLETMRENEIFTPVLMLTAKNDIDDRIEGLSSGADDYLGKPFSTKELIARLNSMIRRSVKYKNAILRCGNIALDLSTNELKSDSGSLRLSTKESELLAVFIKNSDYEITPQRINEILWNGAQNENTVLLYISYLINKLNQLHSSVNISEEKQLYRLGGVEPI
ncbi:MAG: response regulator transcription factor [Lachnospiraceae bacterium]|nr:response regulator transcription factor [Lachnospiraceae bacterium]